MEITFFVFTLKFGGTEKVYIELAKEFIKKGYKPTFIIMFDEVNFSPEQLAGINIIIVNKNIKATSFSKTKKLFKSVIFLRKYLEKNKPKWLIGGDTSINFICILAARLSFTKTKVLASHHNSRFLNRFIWSYHFADKVVAVSKEVGEALIKKLFLPRKKVKVIYNPLPVSEIILKTKSEVTHKWFSENLPVILFVGRLTKQKNIALLLEAFAKLLIKNKARLLIIGEGEERENLSSLFRALNISESVDMPGADSNPYKYMKRSAMLVLPSDQEGFGMVIAEALATGCQVVSTNCKSGPAEILENGKYGLLVTPGDVAGLAGAMEKILSGWNVPKELLLKRAEEFSSEKSATEYLKIIE